MNGTPTSAEPIGPAHDFELRAERPQQNRSEER